MKRLIVLALLVAGCGGCGQKQIATEPRLEYPDAVQVRPFLIWQQWFVEAGRCAGVIGYPFEAIEWYVVPEIIRGYGDDDLKPPSATEILGFHYQGRIYIKAGYEFNKKIIQHEMLHAMGMRHYMVALWVCSGTQPKAKDE